MDEENEKLKQQVIVMQSACSTSPTIKSNSHKSSTTQPQKEPTGQQTSLTPKRMPKKVSRRGGGAGDPVVAAALGRSFSVYLDANNGRAVNHNPSSSAHEKK